MEPKARIRIAELFLAFTLGLAIGVNMSVYFSGLQQNGRRKFYVLTADRPYELDQAAKRYQCHVKQNGQDRWIEITPRKREEKLYLEGFQVANPTSKYSNTARGETRALAKAGGASRRKGGGDGERTGSSNPTYGQYAGLGAFAVKYDPVERTNKIIRLTEYESGALSRGSNLRRTLIEEGQI